MLKVIFRNLRSHYSEEDLMRIEGDDIFVPQIGDDVILNDITVSGQVRDRRIIYDSETDITSITILLDLDR